MKRSELKVKITFIEEILGTSPADPEIHENFIASKAPDAKSRKEEIEAVGVDEVVQKAMTVFPRNKDGVPGLWDYQWRGFIKESIGFLRGLSGTESSAIKAYKKKVDGTIFIKERFIPINLSGEMKHCQRSLRASTAQGERISLANSEAIPEGSTCELTFICLNEKDVDLIKECLDYAVLHGTGQWRNSGKGRFTYEVLSEETITSDKIYDGVIK